jgi:hypothetical protein
MRNLEKYAEDADENAATEELLALAALHTAAISGSSKIIAEKALSSLRCKQEQKQLPSGE